MLHLYSKNWLKIWTVSLIAFCLICLTSAVCEDEPIKNMTQTPPAEGKIVADLGFRPVPDGFCFDNYANDDSYSGITYQNLELEDLSRLLDQDICAKMDDRGECTAYPIWTYWMELANDVMDRGHCYGMAVLSLMFYEGLKSPREFGGDNTLDLQIDGNRQLQREIAYWFSTQLLDPTRNSTIDGTPGEILDRLIASFMSENSTDKYILVLVGRDGPHAVVPFAIEEMGNGEYNILVYDTNHASETNRIYVNLSDEYEGEKIEFWRYLHIDEKTFCMEGYAGTSLNSNMRLIPLSASLAPQRCSYCSGFVKNCIIRADGNVCVLITDEKGRRLGVLDGMNVNEIPGSDVIEPVARDEIDISPVYVMPFLEGFNVTLQGADLDCNVSTNLTMISPSFFAEVLDLMLSPGEKSTLRFKPPNSFRGEGPSFTYWPSGPESPQIAIGISENETSYLFMLDGFRLEKGIAFSMMQMPERGIFRFQPMRTGDYLDHIFGNEADGADENLFDVYVVRYNETGRDVFGHEGLKIEPDTTATLSYADWPGDGHNMSMNVTGPLFLTDKRIWLSDMKDRLPEN